MRLYSLAMQLAPVWAILLSHVTFPATALPEGFVDQGIARVADSTGLNFAPNAKTGGHMLFVAAKRGLVYVIEDPDNSSSSKVALDIQDKVCNNQERGIQTVLPHPDFAENRLLYLYYTVRNKGCAASGSEPFNRLSRFRVTDSNMIDEDSEEFLLRSDTLTFAEGVHNGGAMSFGKDGFLYLALGDAGFRNEAISQDNSHLWGSLLRLTEDGEPAPGNPFTPEKGYVNSVACGSDGKVPRGNDDDTVCQEIYASGLRNPFRFAMDPNTPEGIVRFFINDVGGKAWEEISEGGTDFPGANYGWPLREGPCELASSTVCALDDAPGMADPVHYYLHDEKGSGCAVGGVFPPNGLWPDIMFKDTYMFADYVYGIIYLLTKDESVECRECTPPVSAWKNTTFHEWPRPVDLFFCPYKDTQALCYTALQGAVNIRRIVYEGGSNNAPIAAFTSDIAGGPVNSIVQFDASGSSDADGEQISYQWDFGDGSSIQEADMQASQVSHQYTSSGEFDVELTVIDSSGFTSNAYSTIRIGTPPAATVTAPLNGTLYAVGENFTLVAEAFDINGNVLPDEHLLWEVRRHHASHFHPFLLEGGNSVHLEGAPPPEDFLAATNSYLEVILYASDPLTNLTTTVSHILEPKKVALLFTTEPEGLMIELDGYEMTTPASVVSWENHLLRINAPLQDSLSFGFLMGGINETRDLLVPAVDSDTVLAFTAVFVDTPIVSDMPSSIPSDIPAVPEEVPTPDIPSMDTAAPPNPMPSPADVVSPVDREQNLGTSNANSYTGVWWYVLIGWSALVTVLVVVLAFAFFKRSRRGQKPIITASFEDTVDDENSPKSGASESLSPSTEASELPAGKVV